MPELENAARITFQGGLERLREFLRQLRRAQDEAETDSLIVKTADLLCRLAPLSGTEPENALPDLLSRIGLTLAREGRLSLWAKLLSRFSLEASARREIVAIQASAQTVDLAASSASLEAIFQRFHEPEPPRVDALVELLRVLPATSLSLATRLALKSVPEILLEPVREYCKAASQHHVEGLTDLATDADATVARFALRVVADLEDERVLGVATAALRHSDAGVRVAAIECLDRLASDRATKLLLERLDRRFITPLAAPEEIALYGALFSSGRLDALARVEERLVGPPRGLAARLKALVRVATHDPVAEAVVRRLASEPSAQARDLLQRGTHASNPSVARACREALQGRS